MRRTEPRRCITLVTTVLVLAGCASESDSAPTPDPCAGVQEAVDELAAQFAEIADVPPSGGGRPGSSTWWAPKNDDQRVVIERYAYLVLESGDCFDPQARADAQRFVDSLRGS